MHIARPKGKLKFYTINFIFQNVLRHLPISVNMHVIKKVNKIDTIVH